MGVIKNWKTVELDISPYVEDSLKVKNIDAVFPVFRLSTFSKKYTSIFRIDGTRIIPQGSVFHTTKRQRNANLIESSL
jgi:hypothetical protein